MTKPRKDRVDTSPKSEGLQNPFASLQANGLPTAPNSPGQTPPPQPLPRPKLGRVVLRRETAHRGGKTVVVVDEFAPHHSREFIEALQRRLQKELGCGGTTKDRKIEIQGDQAAKVRRLLEEEGFRVAGVG